MSPGAEHKRRRRCARSLDNADGIDFVRGKICLNHCRVISGRHLSKHGTDRETYMEGYSLTPDELIAEDFRRIQKFSPGILPVR